MLCLHRCCSINSRVLILLLGLALGISSCGYSLRGSDVLSSKYDTLHLNVQQPNSEFARLLRRSLEAADVIVETTFTENLDTEFPVLAIGNEQVISRPITVNPRARAAQYELRLSINIALGQADELLIDRETLFVERRYFEDIENISGNQEEIEVITAEMRRELVNQLMRRLEAAQ
jgi:LPS-assembly lipoprotein